jgi:hypothetical protein
MQSPFFLHDRPFGTLPQLLSTHFTPTAHSESVAHFSRHLPPEQPYG